ncbi:hypothetical protein ACHAXS_008275 [Conticribra weissflogii]
MTNDHDHNRKHQTKPPHDYSLSTLAQTKMALHAARHGTASSPVHGVLLGYRRRGADGDRLHIADAVPICHEPPTKPLVDGALRLVEGYLDGEGRRRKGVTDGKNEMETVGNEEDEGIVDLRIVGWYTANAHVPSSLLSPSSSTEPNAPEHYEMPNIPAMKIASSMAGSHPHPDSPSDFVLVLVSTPALTSILNCNNKDDDAPDNIHVCRIFEREERSKAAASFTRLVPSSRVAIRENANQVLVGALTRVPMTSSELWDESETPLVIYDFVDHVSHFGVDGAEGLGRRDWLGNGAVASFVDNRGG